MKNTRECGFILKKVKIQIEENITQMTEIEIEVSEETTEENIEKLCDELEKCSNLIEVTQKLDLEKINLINAENGPQKGLISIEEFEIEEEVAI